jgi:hypothetical protein
MFKRAQFLFDELTRQVGERPHLRNDLTLFGELKTE